MYLSIYGEYGKCRVVCGIDIIVSEYAERIYATSRRRKETLGVLGEYAKRHKSVYISVSNNTNFNFEKIFFIYIIWNGISQKTISRYCPFKRKKDYSGRHRRQNLL
jgi:hypothetical protein